MDNEDSSELARLDDGSVSASDQSKQEREQAARVARTKGQFIPIRFKGQLLGMIDGQYDALTEAKTAEFLLTRVAPGLGKARIRDIYYAVEHTAPDKTTELSHLIGFGTRVWDMRRLDWRDDVPAEDVVFRVDYTPNEEHKALPWQFVLELAMGDKHVARDILVSIAPLIMETKPDGVIWFLGNGANGKSSLTNLLYIVFGRWLSSVDIKALEERKMVNVMNGKLGNVVRESFSGYVQDADLYKAVGTHEDFTVRKLGTNDEIVIEGNTHHIFNTNSIPAFADKSDGVARRTWTIPFNNRFRSDPTFDKRTFTREFIEGFLYLIIEATHAVKDANYNYEDLFSAATNKARGDYQIESNSADAYFKEMIEEGMIGFANFRLVHQDYQNWCGDNGHVAYTIKNFSRVAKSFGFNRHQYRDDSGDVQSWYRSKIDVEQEQTERFSLTRLGPLRKVRSTEALPAPDDDTTVPQEPEQPTLDESLPDGF